MAHRPTEPLTDALERLHNGDTSAFDEVYPRVYSELHALAARYLARERKGHTLQPTALVHEVYLKLVGSDVPASSRAHFFGVAARVMRQILIDHARRRGAVKHGGGLARVTLNSKITPRDDQMDFDLIDLSTALDRLSTKDDALGRIVELRFFGGLTLDETAMVMGVSRRKVAKDWAFARIWLARELAA